jgi:CRP/FNR family transcriptional regulator, polysaccharide utilization system transcription regulator
LPDHNSEILISQGMKKDEISNIINNLNDQTGKLNCLYAVDEVLSDPDSDDAVVLEKLISIIPQGWRFKDICRVSLTCNEKTYKAEDFKSTELKLSARISLENQVVGELTVAYIKPLRIEKGVFIPEEVILINTIAGKIGNFLLLKKLRTTIKEIKSAEKLAGEESLKEDEKILQWMKKLELTDGEIRDFTHVQLKFRKGETMCKQGSIASFIMLLSSGLSKNYLEGFHERGYNFSIVKPFDFIGLSSLYGSSLYHFSGAALTACSVFVIENSLFKHTTENNPGFARHVLNWYCHTTERHLKRLSCIANKQALGRIAEILLYLKDDIFRSNIINSTISRKDIAELAAMSTESAVRILSDLKKDNIINISGNDIEILDEKLLKTLSYSG